MSVAVTPYTTFPEIPKGVVIRQPNSQFTTNRDGTCTLTESYIGNFVDLATSQVSAQGSNNVEFPTLVVWSVKVTQGKAGIGTLTVESRGAVNALPPPDYCTRKSTSDEPISTHPLWTTKIAGTPAAPLNGAIFVDPTTGLISTASTAIFKDFTTGSIFEGVQSYLCAGLTYTISYADYNAPDQSGVGQLLSGAPEGFQGDTPPNTFWFYSGAESDLHGNIYRIQETYLLTGGVNTQASQILYGSS